MAYKNNNHPVLKIINYLFLAYIIISIFLFSSTFGRRRGISDTIISKEKSCYSNIRIIQGVVEMYNMDVDNDNQMKSLDLNILYENKYLKDKISKPINLPDVKCEYLGENLSETGSVYCDLHGDIEGKTGENKNLPNHIKTSRILTKITDKIEKFFLLPFSILNLI